MAETETPADKQRIAELEQEVADLRQQLADPPAGGDVPSGGQTDEPPDLVPFRRRATTPRLVVLGALIVMVALAGMFAIFQALSSGFEAFSKEAASALVSDPEADDAARAPAPTPGPTPRPAPDDTPRVPGL